jgi:hypothetical protein
MQSLSGKSFARQNCPHPSDVNGFLLPDKDICLAVDSVERLPTANIDYEIK